MNSLDIDEINLNEDKNAILGSFDELNSFIGLSKCFTQTKRYLELLTRVQSDIFLIQAEIASPSRVLCQPERLTQEHMRFIEKQTGNLEQELDPLDHFIMPEGTKFASFLQCIRTMSRRTEREVLAYGKKADLHEWQIDFYARFCDRLACLAFAMARLSNKEAGFKERKPDYYKE